MNKDACYLLGHITKTHGLKGEIKAFLDVDNLEEYRNLESVFVNINGKLIPFFISSIQIANTLAIIKFEDYDSIDEAQKIVGSELYLPLTELPELDSEGFYFHEIKGFTAIDIENKEIGIINDFFLNTGNDLFQILQGNKEILVPIQDQFIKKIDKENKIIQLDLPDGLLELYI